MKVGLGEKRITIARDKRLVSILYPTITDRSGMGLAAAKAFPPTNSLSYQKSSQFRTPGSGSRRMASSSRIRNRALGPYQVLPGKFGELGASD